MIGLTGGPRAESTDCLDLNAAGFSDDMRYGKATLSSLAWTHARAGKCLHLIGPLAAERDGFAQATCGDLLTTADDGIVNHLCQHPSGQREERFQKRPDAQIALQSPAHGCGLPIAFIRADEAQLTCHLQRREPARKFSSTRPR